MFSRISGWVRSLCDPKYNEMIKLVRFWCQAKEAYGPDTVRYIHQMLKNNPEYAKQYVLCYYYTPGYGGYYYTHGYADILKLIITGEGIYRLHVRSDYEVSLQTWSRGEHIATFSNVDDLKTFLCIHNGNAGDQDYFQNLVRMSSSRTFKTM